MVDLGGEPLVAMGFTSGGFPYGPTLSEYRMSMSAAEQDRGWARAKRAIRMAVLDLGLPEPEIGRVRKVGEGLARSAFAAEVESRDWSRVLIALVPHRRSARRKVEDVEREARLLRFLRLHESRFRVPDLAVAVRDGEDSILVCEAVTGIEVDLRPGRMGSIVPWSLVAEIAADIHRIPVGELSWLGGYATRREHGDSLVDRLAALDDAPERSIRDALGWLRDHLPPSEPARLLHGDLLGHNLLVHPGRPTGVLDWEHAILGDPAHDLAIVTRGVRRPFQVDDGLARLLRAYAEHSGSELHECDVRFHEIAMHLEWYARAASGAADVEPAPQVLARLSNLMRAVATRA